MNTSNILKKYKRPKIKTRSTTNPESSEVPKKEFRHDPKPTCPLLAKDSEWVDLQAAHAAEGATSSTHNEDEAVLQLVECEDGPAMKPLAVMFPGLLEKDPATLEGMLTKTMSTTEVTKHLVGQKANFTFMKKANRLIPRDKKWLDSVAENSVNSQDSADSNLFSSTSSDYEADSEIADDAVTQIDYTRKKKTKIPPEIHLNVSSDDITLMIKEDEAKSFMAKRKK